jgi:hypothetical protein
MKRRLKTCSKKYSARSKVWTFTWRNETGHPTGSGGGVCGVKAACMGEQDAEKEPEPEAAGDFEAEADVLYGDTDDEACDEVDVAADLCGREDFARRERRYLEESQKRSSRSVMIPSN